MPKFRFVMGLLIVSVVVLLVVVAYGEVLATWANTAVDLLSRLRQTAAALLNPPEPAPGSAIPGETPATSAPLLTLPRILRWLLVALLAVLALGEGRYRLRQHLTLDKKACPKCGGEVVRIHRTGAERLFSTLFLSGAYHYRCKTCGWNGLRRRRYHGEHADD